MGDLETGDESATSIEPKPTPRLEDLTQEDIERMVAESQQRESYIDQQKGKIGNLSQQLTATQQKQAELEGRFSQFSEMSRKPPEDQKDPLDALLELDEEALDEIRNDPASVVGILRNVMDTVRTQNRSQHEATIAEMVDAVVDVVGKQKQEIDATLSPMQQRFRETDPEILPWRAKIDGIRKSNQTLAKLDDATIIEVLKEAGVEPDYGNMGGPGVRRATPSSGAKKPSEAQYNAAYQLYLKMSGGNAAQAKTATDSHFKRRG